ncbi:C39 family peptidase [Candidatus Parcubacteria bacterium]|nr:C39 family peptidase [Candidatus Parcubacteria bacterium]
MEEDRRKREEHMVTVKTILPVPYVSQYSIGRDSDGLSRACGAACVKMVLDYRTGLDNDFHSILREGQTIRGAYISGIGWSHMGLTALLRNHNVGSYAEEFRAIDVDTRNQEFRPSTFEPGHVERGMQKIAGKILEWKQPVIVSAIKNWKEKDKPHDVVVVGVEKDGDRITGFFYHDPDDESEPGANRFVDKETFRTYWRKFAIFID